MAEPFSITTEHVINEPIISQRISEAEITLHIKRLDQIHPEVNGNKWYKLKYNLQRATHEGQKTLLTFGGPYSNHIHAVAAAGKLSGIRTIGLIRGEAPKEWSATLLFAKACGMQLEFISRLDYAEKETEDFKAWLHQKFGSFHLVPEGGSNFLGVNGCMEILNEMDKDRYDIICVSSGTAATAAGLTMSLSKHQRLISFPALKNGGFIRDEILKHIRYFLMNDELAQEFDSTFDVITDYHFGGYGKYDEELLNFIRAFEKQHAIALDQVYTGKMMFGLFDLIEKKHFTKGTRILAIHTGGLQGRVDSLSPHGSISA